MKHTTFYIGSIGAAMFVIGFCIAFLVYQPMSMPNTLGVLTTDMITTEIGPMESVTTIEKIDDPKEIEEVTVQVQESLLAYNCELSNGTFENGVCECPFEDRLGQTSEEMYDENSGFCQTTAGGPAFATSAGLPYGNFDFWTRIVANQCTSSGGNWITARCTCPAGQEYSTSTGTCNN